MVDLVVDFDDELGFWFFFVEMNTKVICFRPGFRSEDDAISAGDAWIRNELGATLID